MKFMAALIMVLTAPVENAPVDQSQVAALRALIVQDLRLATTGYRLTSANSAYCERTERNPGWVIHDIAQYPDAAVAKATFGFDNPIQVAAVIKDGPADRAQIKAGDGFVGLDDAALYGPAMSVGRSGYERMASIKQLLGKRFAEQSELPAHFVRGGNDVKLSLAPPSVCASDFQIDTGEGLDAGADGQIVRITYGMMGYINDDAELAAVVAHELSHNILRHREKLNAQGIDRGLGRFFGKSKNAILATEIEADRLSIWLMANAGYDPKAALRFWERYGRQYGHGIFSEGTHLRWKNRVRIMQSEIDLMAATKRRDGTVPPPLLVSK